MNLSEINTTNINNELLRQVFYSIEKESYESADFLVIYGCHLKPLLDERLNYALSILNSKKIDKIVLTGGVGIKGDFNESEYMYKYLLQHQIDENKILVDNKSTTTEENNINIVNMLNLNNIDKNIDIVLVTEEPHLLRILLHLKKIVTNELVHFYPDYVEDSILDFDKVINNPIMLKELERQLVKVKTFINDGICVDKKIK